jgi:hypothetical protein
MVVTASLLVGCEGSHLNASPQPTFTAREQAVYAVILRQTFASPCYVLRNLSRDMAYTSDETAQESAAASYGLEELESSELLALWSANSQVTAVSTNLQLGAPYSVIDDETFAMLLESDPRDWKGFYDRYPEAHGFLTIAHVGFNSTGTKALAVIKWQAGGLAARVQYFLLVPNGDTWTIVDDTVIMTS